MVDSPETSPPFVGVFQKSPHWCKLRCYNKQCPFHCYHSYYPNITTNGITTASYYLGNYKGFRGSGQEMGMRPNICISYYTSIPQTLLHLSLCCGLCLSAQAKQQHPQGQGQLWGQEGSGLAAGWAERCSVSGLNFPTGGCSHKPWKWGWIKSITALFVFPILLLVGSSKDESKSLFSECKRFEQSCSFEHCWFLFDFTF